ncbi:MAG: hypothetical protein JSV23_09800 [Promethearchaeota archaeon]|nr:MAG: hypothetical protein JSV23_09800 [Candidatus Lokiarchaeota archaeon]
MNKIVIELIASIYTIIIGLAMFGMWLFLLIKRKVPELKTKPTEIFFHLVAEFLTSIILIIGGIGLIMNQSWGDAIFFIAIGMAIYSTINAAGFYGQLKDWPMFITLIVFTIFSLLVTSLIILIEFQIL